MKTLPQRLNVGTAYFVSNAARLVESLFNPGGTANGTFKKRKHSVLFSRPDGTPFACLVANPGQSRFFVTASKQGAGKVRYMYGLADRDAALLGIAGLSYIKQVEAADAAWIAINGGAA